MIVPRGQHPRLLRAVAWAVAAAGTTVALWVLTVVAPVAQRAHLWAADARRLDAAGLGASALPPGRLAILLAVEDPSFFRHHGVELGTPGRGRTTITQSLAKRLAFESDRPGIVAEVRWSLAALVIDRHLTKEQQLTLFLDTAGLGAGRAGRIEGFPAAAREYFGREVADLSDDEFPALVAMLLAPSTFDPRRHPEALGERVRRIRRLMAGKCAPSGRGDAALDGCAGP